MGLRQNSGMDRPAVIQMYGSVWITCILVWIGGMDRSVGSGYGSGLYILTRSQISSIDKMQTPDGFGNGTTTSLAMSCQMLAASCFLGLIPIFVDANTYQKE